MKTKLLFYLLLLIGLNASSQINVSTGVDATGAALPDNASDTFWKITSSPYPPGTVTIVQYSFPGAWEPTPVASTNAKWINASGNFNDLPGNYTFERDINVAPSTANLIYNLQVSADDTFISLELVRPDLTTIPITITPTTTWHLSVPATNTIIAPMAGTWKIRAVVNFYDSIGAFLLSGTVDLNDSCDVVSDDFSNSSLWTHPLTAYTCPTDYGQIDISAGTFNFNGANDNHFNYMYRTGLSINDTNFKAKIDFTPYAFGSSNGVGHVLLSLNSGIKSFFFDDATSCFGGPPAPCTYPGIAPCTISAQKGIALLYESNSPFSPSTYTFEIRVNDGLGSITLAASIPTGDISGTGTYYPVIERTSATTGVLSVFSDAARSIHITGSPVSFTIPAGITGLNTAQIGVIEGGLINRAMTAAMDNLCITNTAVPVLGVAQLHPSYCGATLTAINQIIVASAVSPTPLHYRFKVTYISGPLTGTVQYHTNTLPTFALTMLPLYAYNTIYKVEVAVETALGWQPYGTPCTVTTPNTLSKVRASQCGSTVTSMGQSIYSDFVFFIHPVTLTFPKPWRFKVTDLSTSLTQIIDKPLNELKLNDLTLPLATYGTTYSIEVAYLNTDETWSNYGLPCLISSPAIPTTQIRALQCNTIIPSTSTQIYADLVTGATNYRFRLSASPTFSAVWTNPTTGAMGRFCRLNNFSPTSLPVGTVYNIEVAVSMDNGLNYGAYGPICTLSTGAIFKPLSSITKTIYVDFNAISYPNPFTESSMLKIDSSSDEPIQIYVYDMMGKLIETRKISNDKSEIEIGSNLNSGVYNIVVTQGENNKTLRIIKR